MGRFDRERHRLRTSLNSVERRARDWGLTAKDVAEVKRRGMRLPDVLQQLDLLRNPPPSARLDRPCVVGDGITAISRGDVSSLVDLAAEEAQRGRFTKFVPASGAATRMFDVQLHLLKNGLQGPECPCVVGDSMETLPKADITLHAGLTEEAAPGGRLAKSIPLSRPALPRPRPGWFAADEGRDV